MFRVRWSPEAMEELSAIFGDADEQQHELLSEAVVEMLRRIREGPYQEGESRGQRRRISFQAPLSMTWHIGEDEVTISILRVRLYRQG